MAKFCFLLFCGTWGATFCNIAPKFEVRLRQLTIMVEGPGCKVKGEKLQTIIKGQTVQTIAGNAVKKVHIYIVDINWTVHI